MNRYLGILGAMLLVLLVVVPGAAAADPLHEDGRIVINVRGDITFPAGQVADSLIVVDGSATIEGDVTSVVVVNSTVAFVGSRSHDVVAIASHVTIDGSSVITGEVRSINTTVDQAIGAVIQGGIRDGFDVARGFLLIGPALFFVYLGFVVAAVVAGLALAGFASRQVRSAERVISREPITTVLAGLAGLFVIITGAILAMVTVIGLPLGFGILIVLLPVLLFAGYLVTGIWLGEWILRRVSTATAPERPYLAAIVGILLLGVVGMIPGVGGLIGFVGFGAIVLLMWRALRRRPASNDAVGQPVSVPSPV
jgi:hypothetical protein